MTHSNDSRQPRGTRRQFTAAALVLLAGVGWAGPVSAAGPGGGGTGASGPIPVGWIQALAIDPDTPTTLYAVTSCLGVLKSLDSGDSWSAANSGLPDTPTSAVTTLAIDPTTPATLYAGTYLYLGRGGGVFKSVNGGRSWSAVNTGLETAYGLASVNALVIDPSTPATLYAGTYRRGVFRSVNGGGSWSAANTGLPDDFSDVSALAIDPSTPATLYAGVYNRGVFRSVDGANSWAAVNSSLTNPDINALAIDPTMPATIYAGTNGHGVFKTLNAGSSWEAMGLTDQYVSELAIDPATPATVYAAIYSGSLFKSVNGGSSWSPANAGLTGESVSAIVIDPSAPATLYAGTYLYLEKQGGGLFKSLDGADAWQATGLGGVICGDGVIACGGAEECDDGGESATCDADCTSAQCGDGTLNVSAGEQCDDGNRNPFDGCTNECTVCGDGVVTPPEECDDGQTSGACDAQCRRPHVVGSGTPESCTEEAFEAALATGSVTFNCGPAPVTITLTSRKLIGDETTIDGGGLITLSGGGAVPIFGMESNPTGLLGRPTLDLRNVTIADGRGGFEGAIYLQEGTLSVTHSVFSRNELAIASVGNGTVVVTCSTFSGNSIYAIFGANRLTVTNSTFSDNGDAAINNEGSLTVANSTFSGNRGDGIANGGTLTMTNSTFSGNGGNGMANGGTLTMTNSTLSGNRGFALSNPGGTATLTNCTLSENGGAISNTHPSGCHPLQGCATAGSVTLTNTIIEESTGPTCAGTDPITDGGHNLQFPGSDCGDTIPSFDPLLDPVGLQNNGGPTLTIALRPGSPAINAGDESVCAAAPVNGLDQRGYVRHGTGSANCSIGAYEFNSHGPPAACVGDCLGDNQVTVDEVMTMVNIALGTAPMSECEIGDMDGDDEITVDEILMAVNFALTECPLTPAEQGCLSSGGTVASAMCCASTGDFPDTCGIGACSCPPDASHEVRTCNCGAGKCFDGSGCVSQ